jgi:hypothetical protein
MITTVTVNQTLIQRLTSPKKRLSPTQDKKKFSHHEMLLIVLNSYKGQTLTASEIKELVIARFPDINVRCILPNDHSDVGNLRACSCVGTDRQLFKNVGRATYYVL